MWNGRKILLSLGGNYFQMTVVKAAKRLGYYVIDADYLPENPAHQYADEYHNISTLDREEILKLAIEKHVDGIVSYASDVSAPTAAWVSEKLGLPTNPYESVHIMTRKDLFHPFLCKKGFHVPEGIAVKCIDDVYDFYDEKGDIILKPVSSSGSKGVTHISDRCQIDSAFKEAMLYSRGMGMAAEKFIHRTGHQIAGDAFVVKGKIRFFGLANEHFNFNCNPLVPVGESFPVALSGEKIQLARDEIQKAVELLNIRNGAINLDFMFDREGKVFIIELGPRNGGNLITDAIQLSTGIDLAEYTVRAAVGDDISDLKEPEWNAYISSYIWHAEQDMKYKSLEIKEQLIHKIVRSDIFVSEGEKICRFSNGGFGIGAALIRYDSQDEMLEMMDHMNQYYTVC